MYGERLHVVPFNGKILCVFSDNVLDDSDHTKFYATLRNGIVANVQVKHMGVYRPVEIGTTRDSLQEMVDFDCTGRFPEQYFEIYSC